MPIQFQCPGCKKILAVSDDNVGMQAKCPACGLVSLVPKSTTATNNMGTDQTETKPSSPPGTYSQTIHEPINSHLLDAILATIFCCPPLGIVGIVFATKCKSQIELDNYDLAQEYSEKAHLWNMAALVLGIGFWMFILAAFGCGPGG